MSVGRRKSAVELIFILVQNYQIWALMGTNINKIVAVALRMISSQESDEFVDSI